MSHINAALTGDDDGDDGLLTSQDFYWRIMPFFLHDAVYLYLKAVNQTLAEGYTDFRDGRLIRNKTIGQRFVGRFLT